MAWQTWLLRLRLGTEQWIWKSRLRTKCLLSPPLEAHIKSLKEECEPLVTNTINQRIEGITPILAAMSCGEYTLELVEA